MLIFHYSNKNMIPQSKTLFYVSVQFLVKDNFPRTELKSLWNQGSTYSYEMIIPPNINRTYERVRCEFFQQTGILCVNISWFGWIQMIFFFSCRVRTGSAKSKGLASTVVSCEVKIELRDNKEQDTTWFITIMVPQKHLIQLIIPSTKSSLLKQRERQKRQILYLTDPCLLVF